MFGENQSDPLHAPTLAAGPIAVMPQHLEPFLAEALDAVPPDQLPDISLAGPPTIVAAALATQLVVSKIKPIWLAKWLATNISFQLRLFSQLTRSRTVALRLETVRDDGCTLFHADAVRFRLLCTYRGPGTEWIDPKALWRQDGGQKLDPASICRLERGAVAFIRGTDGATPERPALVHRSPRIEGTGEVRLLLVIDTDVPRGEDG